MKKLIINAILILGVAGLGQAQSGFSSKSDFIIHNNANGEGVIIHEAYVLDGVVKTEFSSNSNKIVFDKGSSWKQANPDSYVEGYVKSNVSQDFVFPIGNKGIYRPLGLTNAQNSAVAYHREAPKGVSAIKNEELVAISPDEYWRVSSLNSSKITLTFDEKSAVMGLTDGQQHRLAIVGWNGTHWDLIPSRIDQDVMETRSSHLTFVKDKGALSSSITTLDQVELSNYSTFTLGVLTTEAAKKAELAALKASGKLNYNLLKSVHFPFNDKELTVYSTRILNRLLGEVKDTSAQIKLVGHTDFYGSNDYNYELGMERAQTIKAFLVANGIVNVEIELLSEGENKPKVDCKDCPSKEMVLNRRVDIYVLN